MNAVELEIRGHIAWIALNRPDKLNAINDDVLHGLIDAIALIDKDAHVGAAVLFGRGRAFSAGGDIKAMEESDDETFARTIALYMRVAAGFTNCAKPVIAAIHGHALAGGFELSLVCDIRLAAKGTIFGLPDTALGLSPTTGMTYLLPRIVGLGHALHLTLSAENIDADEALRIGLVSRVVEGRTLHDEAQRLAEKMASYPRIGVMHTKSGFYQALDGTLGEATAAEEIAEIACFRTVEVRERFRQFLNRKRK